MQLTPLKRRVVTVMLGGLALASCEWVESTKDDVEEKLESDVTGVVRDDRGQPVAGASVRLYSLLGNTHFVEGGDIRSAEAYIDRHAILVSKNTVETGQTDEDGRFNLGAIPNAFLAVAVKKNCSADFAGFDAETGVLNVDTLITPNLKDGVNFEIDDFVIACATPPADVGPEGNTPEAPPFEPPTEPVSCDPTTCEEAGGSCEEDTCVLTCVAETCEAAGGTCVDGACEMPACEGETCCAEATCCDAASCETAGGLCSEDGTSCRLPACSSDADCESGQPGAFCENPGDVELATCRAPSPEEIVPPLEPEGWTGFRVTDSSGDVLADASTENQSVADIPADGTVRVYADYDGPDTTAYVQIQSGGAACPNFPPRTDYIAVDIVDGKISTADSDYLEVALHGGYQRLQLSTTDVPGEGERSFVIELGEPCAPPEHAFTAILTWEAGPGEPADLDLNIWNKDDELVFVGDKQSAWGQLRDAKGPGPEVFESDDPSLSPFTIKVQFFSGKPRDIEGKVRVIRTVDGQLEDSTYVFHVGRPKDVAEIGVFAAE